MEVESKIKQTELLKKKDMLSPFVLYLGRITHNLSCDVISIGNESIEIAKLY